MTDAPPRRLNAGGSNVRVALLRHSPLGQPIACSAALEPCPFVGSRWLVCSTVLSSGEVRQYLAGIIDVRLNSEKGQTEQAIASRDGVTGYPTYFSETPDALTLSVIKSDNATFKRMSIERIEPATLEEGPR